MLLLASACGAYAQTPFDRAKENLRLGQYGLAASQFDKLASGSAPQAGEARYLAAVARYRAGEYTAAAKGLLPIERITPPPAYAPQAEELLGACLLHERKWQAGTRRLAAQKTESSQKALYALLLGCPADTLKRLAARYPDAVGLQLRKEEAGPKKIEPAPASAPKDIEEVRIALVLPLTLPKALGDEFKQQPGMAEFCAAARLAEADARSSGDPVRLYFYDTHRSADTLARLMAGTDLETMDLLLGPVYAKETEALARFAEQKKVPLVNPLTNRIHFDAKGRYAYLAEPALNDMAAAALALRNPGGTKKVGCIYGTSAQDSALAEAFQRQAKETGCTMVLFKKVAKNSAANLTKFITEAGLDSNSVLFVPNAEPLVKAQLMSALEITRSPALTVTYGSWIEESETPLDRFERLRIRFLYPDYAGYGDTRLEKLRTRIQQAYGLPATEVGLKAYDLVRTLGHALAQAKPANRSSFLKDYSPLRSEFSAGYDYTQGQTNGRVPIYHFFEGRLERE